MNHKITILGCGFSGMLTALSFASHNIKTTIIETRDSKAKDFCKDPRTTALTASSKKFFEEIGIWEDLVKASGPLNDIYILDNKADGMLHFSSLPLETSERMGYMIQNTDFKRILLDAVISNQLIELIDNTASSIKSNTEIGCELVLTNSKEKLMPSFAHKCDLLIACNGNASLVKKNYFTNELEKSYDQYALTFITRHEKPHDGTSVEHFMKSGPFAILPLKDQNLSSIVWVMPPLKKDAIMNLPRDEFTYLVQQNFGEFLGKIVIEDEVAAFPLRAALTRKYYNKRIVLVADTAHVIHPLAGQGLNQGIKDIKCLVSLILQYGINDYMLEQYQKARKNDNSNMLELTDLINSIFSQQSKFLHNFRQIGFMAIEKIPFLKKSLIKYAMGKR